jgi:hypothetical protein
MKAWKNWPKRNVEKKKRDPSTRYQVQFTGSLWVSSAALQAHTLTASDTL